MYDVLHWLHMDPAAFFAVTSLTPELLNEVYEGEAKRPKSWRFFTHRDLIYISVKFFVDRRRVRIRMSNNCEMTVE